jgi:hypothetical protein
MKQCRIPTIMMAISLSTPVYGANPFLAAQDNKPVSAKFCGTEWGDKIQHDQIPLTARVVTTRVAKTSWGAIFKIEFTDLESNAPQKREIRPDYFIVTDDRIVLSNEEDNEAAVKKISALDKPPEFELGDIYGITMGKFSQEDGLWKTAISVKGDLCIYDSSHPSGHFKKIVWKKGVGLVEYASGYGAHSDGFRLKRQK